MSVPGGHFYHNVHHLELMARARMDDAMRRAQRGAHNVRLGVHQRRKRRSRLGRIKGFLARIVGRR
jgi:hypothetical protein